MRRGRRTVAVVVGPEDNVAVIDEGDERERVDDEAQRPQDVVVQRRNRVAVAVRLVQHVRAGVHVERGRADVPVDHPDALERQQPYRHLAQVLLPPNPSTHLTRHQPPSFCRHHSRPRESIIHHSLLFYLDPNAQKVSLDKM
jgi:hypothetical protein